MSCVFLRSDNQHQTSPQSLSLCKVTAEDNVSEFNGR